MLKFLNNATTSADLDNELGVVKIFRFTEKASEWFRMVITEYPHYILYLVIFLVIIITLKLLSRFLSKKYIKSWDKKKKEFQEAQRRGDV